MRTQRSHSALRMLYAAAIWTLAAPGLLFPVSFNAPRAYPLGPRNIGCGLTVGDFNGDGTPDVAVQINGSDESGFDYGAIVVFLAKGDGTFLPSQAYRLPSVSSNSGNDVIAVDFNGDGMLDLAAVDSSGVAILLGNGDGTFQPAVNINLATSPYSVASADFNGDGIPDLAVTNPNSNNVSILLGNGDGTFAPAVNYAVGTGPSNIVVGDFNGDGKPDVAVTNSASGTVSILFGIGDGAFRTAVNHDVGSDPTFIAAGDFNGDGKPDLAITHGLCSQGGGPCPEHGRVTLLLSKSGGGFLPPVTIAAGTSPSAVAVLDVSGNGKLDLAVANQGNNDTGVGGETVSILKGNGDGTFQAPVAYAVAATPRLIGFGDFNGDGKLDLAAIGADSLSILLNNGHGGFARISNVAVGATPRDFAAGDFNGDGKPDLAVAITAGVSILLGNGDGTFRPPVTYAAGNIPSYIAVGDFNGDGKLDLAVVDFESSVSILFGNGDGTFQAPITTASGPAGVGPLAVGDFNGDGKLDLAMAGVGALFDLAVWLGNGDGTFQQESIPLYEDTATTLGAGNLTGNGRSDLVLQLENCDSEYCVPSTQALLGNSNGTFTGAGGNMYLGGSAPIVRDFNGDGKEDIAASGGAYVYVALGNGDGTFQTPGVFPGLSDALAAGDFNRDGKPDIAANGVDTVDILLGNGDGTFQPQMQFIVGCNSQNRVVVADFNGDGKPDVATTDDCTNSVTILTNTTR